MTKRTPPDHTDRATQTLHELRGLYAGPLPAYARPLQFLIDAGDPITKHAYNSRLRIIRNGLTRDGLNPYNHLTYPEVNR